MRKYLISSVAFLGLLSSAQAADLAPAPPPVPVFTWTGFYAGLNAGYMWSEGGIEHHCFNAGGGVFGVGCGSPLGLTGREGSGWLAGGQIGYNFQFRSWGGGNWVFGAEADLQAADINRSSDFFDPAHVLVGTATGPLTFAGRAEIDWFGTVRGRLGVAWDRVLVYGTGGAIFANVNTSHLFSLTSNANGDRFVFGGAQSAVATGWIAGGGIEYAFTNNLSLKAEAMYYELGNTHADGNLVINGDFARATLARSGIDIEHHGFLVRGGINWRFWGM